MRISLACLVVALAGCVGQASPIPAHAEAPDPALTTPGLHAITLAVGGDYTTGYVAVPAGGRATALVVLAKGLGVPAEAWRPFMEELATRGAASIAMEYRGAQDAWKVRAGAEDTLAAAHALRRAHPEATRVILYGVSMGGEASGLALAHAPRGTFTHWLAGSGVMDLRSEWQDAASFQPLIEAEAGATPLQAPAAYSALSPIDQVPAIAAQGLRRAYFVHGAGDTVVPAEQADRMVRALSAAGVPVSHTVILSEPNAWACTPAVIACAATAAPNGPAGHEAGISKVALDILRGLVEGKPDPDAAFQRTWVEGGSGASVEA
ncbi:MAG TPA: prolyl oligopeptidase family serine peptidase [Candidatus Thermoplasmatota archaeon]|nr:prolyl oligopeptidase family serine peptidase [Candidatus Thermoplasmatota archaeon]